jgi:FkbM family methyltransferase
VNPGVKALLRRLLPKSIGPKRIRGGLLRGAWIVTSWHDYPAALVGTTERPLLAWFENHAKPGDTWLDVGAHYGYTAFALSKLAGKGGRVFTFEPVIATAGCVAQGRDLNGFEQLTVLPVGLGAPDSLILARAPVTRGMADSTVAVSDHTWFTHIPIVRFDWLWPRICDGNPHIHGIKIDVQGMELEVLRGMRETLCSQRPLLALELHLGVTRRDVLELLAGVGYSTRAIAIEPLPGESEAQFHDNRSYVFHPA